MSIKVKLYILSSTVFNIIKVFWKSAENWGSEIIAHEHSLPSTHKTLSSIEIAISEHDDPEIPPSSLDQSLFKMDWGKVENSSVIQKQIQV